MDMTIQLLLPMVLSFFVGCVFVEIRWIGRIRRLRGKLSLVEAMREYAHENGTPEPAAAAVSTTPDNTRESLLNLQQTLTFAPAPAQVAELSENRNR